VKQSNVMASDASARAKDLIAQSIVCDLTLPWEEDIPRKARSGIWERYSKSGFSFVSLSVADDVNWIGDTVPYIKALSRLIERSPERFVLARTAADIETAKNQSRMALGFHFQGTNPFQGRLEMVQGYYDFGVRHALLAYNQRNLVGDGCHERTDGGLSRYGLALIAEMNRVGILVDCTHSGYRTTMEALEASTQPCMFSHSNARALMDHERNIRDDQIRAVAKTGGVVGINGVGFMLDANGKATADGIVRHIQHVADLVGPAHVALGLDFVIDDDHMLRFYQANRDLMYPTGYPPPPWNYYPPEGLCDIVATLLERGYGEDHIKGILGGNFLRLAREVWH
jgi:membrane dipeptidase